MAANWYIYPVIPEAKAQEFGNIPPVLKQVLFNRGVYEQASARQFLKAALEFDNNPFLILDMDKAVERIQQAYQLNEKLVVYGDYDVDGVTATALLVSGLSRLGFRVSAYIPNRFEEGYGINNEALRTIKADGAGVVISVDCGIRSLDESLYAKSIGLDMIITDHHEPGEDIPEAVAVINPKRAGDTYPEKYLAGVGLAFKLLQALHSQMVQNGIHTDFEPDEYLDLVALGTVADLAPLTGENRFYIRKGIRQIQKTRRVGIAALAAVADTPLENIDATAIGFRLAPRLNAAGRLESALLAYDLLSATNNLEAGKLAQILNVKNSERQKATKEIKQKAEELTMMDGVINKPLLFAAHPEFNQGVMGLAASKLTEDHYRPAIVGSIDLENGTTHCSCRSIPEYNIEQALERAAVYLEKFGGHAAAAGFTIKNENIEPFVEFMSRDAEKVIKHDLGPTLKADMILNLDEINFELVDHLRYLEPTGQGNPSPKFVTPGLRVRTKKKMGKDSQHLKLFVTNGHQKMEAIWWNKGDQYPVIPETIDLFYSIDVNEFNLEKNLQLLIKDLKIAE